MTKRKKSANVLETLSRKEKPQEKPSPEPSSPSVPPTQSVQPAQPTVPKAAAPEKSRIKATHYLHQETLWRLDDALIQIQRMTGVRSIHRYAIVEQALQIILTDLEQNGTDSMIGQRFITQNR